MKEHKLEVTYTFRGTVKIVAENFAEAIQIFDNDFGCVSPHYHTNNEEAVKDWDFDMHPQESNVETIYLTIKKDQGSRYEMTAQNTW